MSENLCCQGNVREKYYFWKSRETSWFFCTFFVFISDVERQTSNTCNVFCQNVCVIVTNVSKWQRTSVIAAVAGIQLTDSVAAVFEVKKSGIFNCFPRTFKHIFQSHCRSILPHHVMILDVSGVMYNNFYIAATMILKDWNSAILKIFFHQIPKLKTLLGWFWRTYGHPAIVTDRGLLATKIVSKESSTEIEIVTVSGEKHSLCVRRHGFHLLIQWQIVNRNCSVCHRLEFLISGQSRAAQCMRRIVPKCTYPMKLKWFSFQTMM